MKAKNGCCQEESSCARIKISKWINKLIVLVLISVLIAETTAYTGLTSSGNKKAYAETVGRDEGQTDPSLTDTGFRGICKGRAAGVGER